MLSYPTSDISALETAFSDTGVIIHNGATVGGPASGAAETNMATEEIVARGRNPSAVATHDGEELTRAPPDNDSSANSREEVLIPTGVPVFRRVNDHDGGAGDRAILAAVSNDNGGDGAPTVAAYNGGEDNHSDGPVQVLTDNKAAHDSCDLSTTAQSRHINRTMSKVQELREAGAVTLTHILTESDPADIMTKVLSRQTFEEHRKMVLNTPGSLWRVHRSAWKQMLGIENAPSYLPPG